jgi:putative PEP-CTERM system TPR-repeat lipoprotein
MDLRSLARIVMTLALAAALGACGRSDPTELVASAKTYLAKGDARAAMIELKNALQSAPDNAEARFLLARALQDTGDAVGAETEARKALQLGYSPDEAYPVLARALLAQGEYRKVITELADRKLATPAGKAEVLTAIGLARLSLGEKKEAGAAIEAALAAKPGDARATVALAQLAAADNDLQVAMSRVETALAVAPDDVTGLLLKSELELALGKREDAIKTLEHALKVKPDLLVARLTLVSALAGAKEADRAAAVLEPLKKAMPQDARVRYAEALILYARGDLAGTKEAVQGVLSAAPEYVPAIYLSGIVNYALGAYGEAEEALRTVVAKAPDNVSARRMLAATYLRSGRVTQAAEVLEPALVRAPDDPALLRAAAEVQLSSNNPAKAAELYERANALDKGNAASRVRLAQVRLAAGGDAEQAMRELESIADANPTLAAADLALVSAHLRRRETDQALAAADAFAKKQPSNPLAWNVKGVVYTSKRDFAAARASFDQALKVDPGYIAAAYNLAQLDLVQRNADGARKGYERILAKDPRNEQALLAIATVLAVTRAPAAEIRAALERAINANPSAVRPRVALINYYAQQHDAKDALAAAQAANNAIPNNPQLLELLGSAQLAAGENNQALDTLAQAAKLQPQSAQPLLRLAGAQASLKDYNASIATLKKAIAVQPDMPASWLALAGVYIVSNQLDAGIVEARRLQKDLPTRATGYGLEGNLLMSQKKPLDAAKAYREALAREPLPILAASLYSALQAAGRRDQAVAMAQQWQKENPKDVVLLALRGQQALLAKDYKTAVAHLRAAVEIEPDNIVTLNNLAWALNELGDPKAIEYADRAAHLAPYAPSVMDTQGWVLVAQGNTSRGIELLRMASGLAPQDADIRLHLAKSLLKSGDKAGAKTELEAVAVLTKPSPARTEAQQMLKEL